MRLNATIKDINTAWAEWNASRLGKGQRFGQFVINNFGKDGLVWPELFYSNDPNEAYVLAMLEVISEQPA